MNNYYKELTMKLLPFKLYLKNNCKLAESTASDYIKRIITICREENIDLENLETNIEKYCFDYIEGEKKELGARSHNSYRSALLQYKAFVSSGVTSSQSQSSQNKAFRLEINKIPNEKFGIIRLFDSNNNLIDIDTTLNKELHSTDELTRDLYLKCINMLFRSAYAGNNKVLAEVLSRLDVSLTIDNKPIRL